MISVIITTATGDRTVARLPSRALGLDPGKTTGWGVVSLRESAVPTSREIVLAYGVLDEDPVRHLGELIREYHPDVVGIEVVRRVHQVRRGGVNGISTVQALALYQAGLIAGDLRTTARHLGVRVHEHSVEEVRAALAGKATADDAAVEGALRFRLVGFPAPRQSNTHNRDGLAVALFALLDARLRARGDS